MYVNEHPSYTVRHSAMSCCGCWLESRRHGGDKRNTNSFLKAPWVNKERYQSSLLLSEAKPSAWINHLSTGQKVSLYNFTELTNPLVNVIIMTLSIISTSTAFQRPFVKSKNSPHPHPQHISLQTFHRARWGPGFLSHLSARTCTQLGYRSQIVS